MRLLNTSSLTLESFGNWDVPKYAILSHTWGAEEVLFEDFKSCGRASRKSRITEEGPSAGDADAEFSFLKGWSKVKGAAALAHKHGYDYIWIDTCSIDKSSSSELSEAINSMFRWYKEAEVCFAFLSDVHLPPDWSDEFVAQVKASRWMKRGWTLQELIAPSSIQFHNANWEHIGSKAEHQDERFLGVLAASTKVPKSILWGADLELMSVAQKMFWASERETERPEDMAYSLMGIFNVNMPLLYGEGGEKAFQRLQEEILKATDDESLFAWRMRQPCQPLSGIMAPNPSCFADGRFVVSNSWRPGQLISTPSITNRGLRLQARITKHTSDPSDMLYWCVLSCISDKEDKSLMNNFFVILLQRLLDDDSRFIRARPDLLGILGKRVPGGQISIHEYGREGSFSPLPHPHDDGNRVRFSGHDINLPTRSADNTTSMPIQPPSVSSRSSIEDGGSDIHRSTVHPGRRPDALFTPIPDPEPRHIFISQSQPSVRFYFPLVLTTKGRHLRYSSAHPKDLRVSITSISHIRYDDNDSFLVDPEKCHVQVSGQFDLLTYRFSYNANLSRPLGIEFDSPVVLGLNHLLVTPAHFGTRSKSDPFGALVPQQTRRSKGTLEWDRQSIRSRGDPTPPSRVALVLGLAIPPAAPSETPATFFMPWYKFMLDDNAGDRDNDALRKLSERAVKEASDHGGHFLALSPPGEIPARLLRVTMRKGWARSACDYHVYLEYVQIPEDKPKG